MYHIEQEFQNRLLGITPTHEQKLHNATIFAVTPDLAFLTAYVDGYLAALSTIEKRVIHAI